jgi:hypothetical protein
MSHAANAASVSVHPSGSRRGLVVGRWWGLHPYEWLALGGAVSALLFLRARGLHYGLDTAIYLFPPLLRALPRVFLFGVGLRLVRELIAHRGDPGAVRDYLRAIADWRWLVSWLRAWLGVMLFVYAYCWLKVSVPLVHKTLFDPQLWRLDRWLHFGISPSVFAVELLGNTAIARWLDAWYALWVPTLVVFVAYFVADARGDRVRNFVLATVALWTAGAWIYVALPALGPCYASRDLFAPIARRIPESIFTQRALWSNYLEMVRLRTGALSGFQPEFGVAAMPSLHVGMHALFFFWARRHERWLQIPAAIATVLTFTGSIVTGWHYAIDGYVGIALAWLVVVLADRLEPVAGQGARSPKLPGPKVEAVPESGT